MVAYRIWGWVNSRMARAVLCVSHIPPLFTIHTLLRRPVTSSVLSRLDRPDTTDTGLRQLCVWHATIAAVHDVLDLRLTSTSSLSLPPSQYKSAGRNHLDSLYLFGPSLRVCSSSSRPQTSRKHQQRNTALTPDRIGNLYLCSLMTVVHIASHEMFEGARRVGDRDVALGLR